MFAVFFSGLVIAGLLTSVSEMFMRVRLTEVEEWNRLPWWRRGGDRVAAAYQELFPRSRLPLFRELTFWLVIACPAGRLITILWKSK
jgi:hypothetical protein